MDLKHIKQPIFIPNLQDLTTDEPDLRYLAILADATHINWRPKTFKKLKAKTDLFIVDPSTDKLMFKDAKAKINFKKLKYPEVEPEILYSDADFRTKKIVYPAIEDQIKKGADVLIVPYLFFEDTDDIKFTLNLSMISDSIQYIREKKIEKPIFAMIKVGKTILTRPTIIDYIVSRYKEDFSKELSGFLVTINDFDSKREDLDTLLGFAIFISKLSEESIVFIVKINDFGFVLSAIGAAGFSSGMAGGELFSAKNLQDNPKGWNSKIKKTYVPELFDYVNDNLLKKMGYKCHCPICGGNIPQSQSLKKKHFLYSKINFSDSLSSLSRDKQAYFLKNKLRDAIKYGIDLSKRYKADIKISHLSNWERVLNFSASWEKNSENDKELDLILEELEKKHD